MDDLFKQIDAERDSRFKKPWPKLDKGSKLNRLSLFVKMEKTERDLSDEEEKKLKILVTQLCETGALNKSGNVTYADEKICELKGLDYDEDTREYSFKREEKKSKPSQKSKGNIERHFSRSKETKR